MIEDSNTGTHTIVTYYSTYFVHTFLSFLPNPWLFACLLASILELSFSRLHGSNPSLHYPLLPHYSTVLTFLAFSNRFSSPASHRTSLIAQLKTPLRCVYYWTKRGNAVAHLSFASWYQHSTLPTRRCRQATYFPPLRSVLPATIPSRLPPETFLPRPLALLFASLVRPLRH